jgi:thermitase
MNRLIASLAALTLVGCASPTQQAPAPQLGETVDPQGAFTVEPARQFKVTSFAVTDRVVVRFKAGHEKKAVGRGSWKRAMGLERTHVFSVANATERDALLAELAKNPDVEVAEPDYIMQASALSNDPSVGSQWSLPKIQADAGWTQTAGLTGPLVAVVDSGVDYNHPDLAGKVVKGQDFVNNDADPMDDQGHGTHCAGVIAATTNNGVGVAGMTTGSKILAVKVLAKDGSGSTSAIADGNLYAARQGAKVISLSLGGPGQSSVLKSAVDQAVAAGAVVVVAAGNDGSTVVNYPAGYDNVIAVGATTSADARASFSQYGTWVDIAAPGDKILSTINGNRYSYMSGTSMAAPHVAGAAALVRTKVPNYTVAQVRQALETTGDPVTGFSANPALRRLNVAKALGVASTPTPAPTATPAPAATPTPVATPAPARDVTAPVISNMVATNVGSSSATIAWTTNEPADGQVQFGLNSSFGRATAIATARTTGHGINLYNLNRGTTYYYRTWSRDAAGNVKVSWTSTFRTRSW